jgi:hypothetical protein
LARTNPAASGTEADAGLKPGRYKMIGGEDAGLKPGRYKMIGGEDAGLKPGLYRLFPGRLPIGCQGTSLYPINRLRSGQGVGIGFCTQALAHRIPPDVAGGVFDRFAGPQDVIVKPTLPKTLPVYLAEFIRCALLESIDELHKVRGVGKSFGKKVEMVGHSAICMKTKPELASEQE